MHTRRLFLSCALIAIVALTGRSKAAGPTAAFHAVGDLPGGGFTTSIQDATKVNGVIYAVGTAVGRRSCIPSGLCSSTDAAVLWQFDGTNATLQALPDIVPNSSAVPETAFAITPDAAYIASQLRDLVNGVIVTRGVRVTTSLLPSPAANVNLAAAPFSTPTPPTSANAISIDGTILYGTRSVTVNGAQLPRVVRFDTAAGTSIDVPPFSASDANAVVARGTSDDGSVAVGVTNAAGILRAYRYTSSAGMSAPIPLLPGGTTNRALAVGPDGYAVLVTGNSAEYPNGEAYVFDASTQSIERLGSPNAPWAPGGRRCLPGACTGGTAVNAGMAVLSSTTRVVAMNFSGSDGQYAYIHNPYGWFHLTSVLAANGVDVAAAGWSNLVITGMSRDAMLVYGSGAHNGSIDGFVAEFGSGVLASFNPTPVAPTNTSIVGAWGCSDPNTTLDCVLAFTADGAYYHIQGGPSDPEPSGFERGYYTFDGSQITFTTLIDTNGSTGTSDTNGASIPATIINETLMLGGQAVAYRIPGVAGTLAGAWVEGTPTQPDSSLMIVFSSSGRYLMAWDDRVLGTNVDGIEIGQFSWDPATGALVPDISQGVHISTSGGDGLTDLVAAQGPITATLTPDGLGLLTSNPGSTQPRRVIDPATIPAINSPLSASGIVGQVFSYGVTATNTSTFGATGLPNGLTINSGTGVVGGTPSVGGQFEVILSAANAAGVVDFKTLTVTIAIPTPVGQNVVVQPDVPAGQGPMTMTFGEITSAGTTTVTVLDLGQSSVPPPGSVDIGGVVYEVQTTAQYTGLIQLCFSYAGINFGTATPRLFHYENNAWVDITTSVDTNTQTICGATTSLSPFAVLVSHVVRTGFYAPMNPIAGFLNTVKGGATVPLKFKVYVDGIEKKTTDGLQFTVQTISCDSNAPQDPVDFTVAGETSLRYDSSGGYFVQNWKVPKTAGCYMVRMTTAQDGLSLTARFKAN